MGAEECNSEVDMGFLLGDSLVRESLFNGFLNTEIERQFFSLKNDRSLLRLLEKSCCQSPTPKFGGSKLAEMFGIKKLAHQFNKVVGSADISILPQKLQAQCKDCEGYKATLIETCDAMIQIMQGNPDYKPAVESNQKMQYPPGTAPSEIFEKCLPKMKGYWYDEKLVAECSKACKLIAAKQRELQDRGRRQLHNTRTFINSGYAEYEVIKNNLISAKQELDEAKEDQNKSDTGAKRKVTKKAQKLYDKELKVMENYFNVVLPALKIEHMKEIEAILLELQSYHDWMASYCRPFTTYNVPPPANL